MNELTTTEQSVRPVAGPSHGRTLDVVAAEIRTFTASMLNNIIEIGRRLCEAKELVPYGQFGTWVKENTGYSSSTANNFMRLFQEYGAAQGSLFGAELSDVQTFGKLSYTKALALLAVPAEEREEFVRENDVEAMSTRELEQAIKERDEACRARDEAEDAAGQAQEERDEAKERAYRAETELQLANKKIQELEHRPVEVAVQEPDPAELQKRIDAAVEDAMRAAKTAAAEDKKALEDKLAAAEQALENTKKEAESWKETASDAVEKLKDASPEEKAVLEREIAELKKKLAMSDKEVASFTTLFQEWGSLFGKMMQTFRGIESEETRGKLLKALRFQLDKFGEAVK